MYAILFSFYRWGNWNQKVNRLSKVTQLVRSWNGIWTYACPFQSSSHYFVSPEPIFYSGALLSVLHILFYLIITRPCISQYRYPILQTKRSIWCICLLGKSDSWLLKSFLSFMETCPTSLACRPPEALPSRFCAQINHQRVLTSFFLGFLADNKECEVFVLGAP